MKKILYLLLLFAVSSYAQDTTTERKGYWSLSAGYTYDFYVDGYVFVKEINSFADSLSFNEDLNVSHWHNVSLKLSHTFKNDASIRFSFERFIFTATNRVKRNIYYNDLVIDGNAGISIKDTRMYRGYILYEQPLTKRGSTVRCYLDAGLMYDYIHFEITGNIINEGNELNFEEDFNDQIIPAPVLGLKGEWSVGSGDRSIIFLEARGTYVSHTWTDLYKYEHTAVNGEIGYRFNTRNFFVAPKLIARHIHSREDGGHHVFDITTVGGGVELGVKF